MKLALWRDKDAQALVEINRYRKDSIPSGYLWADTLAHAKLLIANYQLLPKSRGSIYALWYHHQIIGYIQLMKVYEGCWEVGYYLDPQKENHGYMSKAIALLIQMKQEDQEIKIIQARVLKHNLASIQVLTHNHFHMIQTWDDILCYQRVL